MEKGMKTGDNGIKLIKKYEGFRAKAYLCPAKVWTIGYGTTKYPNGKPVMMGDVCTEKQAEEYLRNYLSYAENSVGSVIRVSLSQNQFDAIISFVYNLGIGSFSKSTLLKKINDSPYDPSIHAEFLKWNKAGGVVLNGLTKRREEETQLYFKLT
jgi:lysozyme